jgi:uncharacterized membrane protein
MRVLVLMLLVACGGEDPVPVFGPPTETVCPPGGTTLTYDNFAKQFMDDYCTRCHAITLEGAARHGAPEFHDFDSYFGIRGVADHIDETTAAGPAAINRGMPQDGNKPTDEERFLLGEWIACDLPQ